MAQVYVYCRYWNGFKPPFPVERFNDLPEDEIQQSLIAEVNRVGPPEEALKEWLGKHWSKIMRTPPKPRDYLSSMPLAKTLRPGSKLEKWQNHQPEQTKDCVAPIKLNQNCIKVYKLKLFWLEWWNPELDLDPNHDFKKRHILTFALKEDIANVLISALAMKYPFETTSLYFGRFRRESVPDSNRLLCDLEAEENFRAAVDPRRVQKTLNYLDILFSEITKCALDLLRRVLPQPQQNAGHAGASGERISGTNSDTEKKPAGQSAVHVAKANGADFALKHPEDKKSNRGGRPRVTEKEEKQRIKLVEAWKRAKSSGVQMKDFAHDKNTTVRKIEGCNRMVIPARTPQIDDLITPRQGLAVCSENSCL